MAARSWEEKWWDIPPPTRWSRLRGAGCAQSPTEVTAGSCMLILELLPENCKMWVKAVHSSLDLRGKKMPLIKCITYTCASACIYFKCMSLTVSVIWGSWLIWLKWEMKEAEVVFFPWDGTVRGSLFPIQRNFGLWPQATSLMPASHAPTMCTWSVQLILSNTW